MKYKKEELEKYLFDDNLNYRQIGEIYKVSGVWIRKKALQLGIELQKKDRKDYYCLNCGKEIQRMAHVPVYCNNKCQGDYKRRNNIEYWLNNQEKFSDILLNHSKSYIKEYRNILTVYVVEAYSIFDPYPALGRGLVIF